MMDVKTTMDVLVMYVCQYPRNVLPIIPSASTEKEYVELIKGRKDEPSEVFDATMWNYPSNTIPFTVKGPIPCSKVISRLCKSIWNL